MMNKKQRVVVVGASSKPERYSNRAVRLLLQYQHEVLPVHPAESAIEGVSVLKDLTQVTGPIDTVTLYVSATISSGLAEGLRQLKPGRVIFNPGSENPELRTMLEAHGIPTEEACTLVLLSSDQF